MIWLITIPLIIYETFYELIGSNFPPCYQCGGRGFLAWCFLIFVGCFISGLISAVPFGVAAIIGSFPGVHGVHDKDYPLVALRERDGIKGDFYFLGAGHIEDQQYYFWYRKDGSSIRGGKTLRTPGVRIFEDDSAPRMVTFKTEYTTPSITSWFWLIGLDLRDENDWLPDFHIPAGSIKEGYSL